MKTFGRNDAMIVLFACAGIILSVYLAGESSRAPLGGDVDENNIVGDDKIADNVVHDWNISPDWNMTPSLKVAGVSIYEKIPYTALSMDGLTLYTATTPAELTCNFELTALSTNMSGGYGIILERGDSGVYLEESYARIRGNTDAELLDSCHAFVCLKENISCPVNLSLIGDIVRRNNVSYLVIDNSTGAGAGMGYLEIIGALGFLQAQIADGDGDGELTEAEVEANRWHIMPYVKEGGRCRHMPMMNGIQDPVDIDPSTDGCMFPSGIFILPSDINEISIEGERIHITGDDDHLRKASVVIRDIISPEWIRAYYNS